MTTWRAVVAVLAVLAAVPAGAQNAHARRRARAPPIRRSPTRPRSKQIVGFDVDVIQAVAAEGRPQRPHRQHAVHRRLRLAQQRRPRPHHLGRHHQRPARASPTTSPRRTSRRGSSSPCRRRARCTSLQDLAGKKVGVVTGSTADDVASRAFGKTSPNIRRFDTTPLIIAELVAGGVDAAIGDNGVIAYRVQEHKSLKTVNDPGFPKEYFGIVVKQGNTALRDRLNTGAGGHRRRRHLRAASTAPGSRPSRPCCRRSKRARAAMEPRPLVRLVPRRHHRGVRRALLAAACG